MAECNIPGFSIYSVENAPDIVLQTLEETKSIPYSHRFGNCRPVTEFEKVAKISEGWFGVLFKIRDKPTKQYYTLKKYRMDLEKGVPSYVIQERSLLSMLLHDNIIKCHGVAVNTNLESNYIVLDYCPVSLFDLLEKKTQIKVLIEEKSVVRYIMKQIFEGLEFIHRALIIHRDVYDGNILFTESGKLKITGFHSSRFASKGDMGTLGFTEVSFRAPELLLNSKKYGPAVDMWSAGCILAKLLLKKPLFKGDCDMAVIRSINYVLGTPTEQLWPGVTELLKKMDKKNFFRKDMKHDYLDQLFEKQPSSSRNLVKNLLMYFPDVRLSAKECLQSSYFADDPACTEGEKRFKAIMKIVLSPKAIEEDPIER